MKKSLLKKLISAVITTSVTVSAFCAFSAEVFAAETPYNLTQNGGVNVTASSGAAKAQAIIDGNKTTSGSYTDDAGNTCYYDWSASSSKDITITVDLGRVCDATEIKLYLGYIGTSENHMPKQFDILYSIDGNDSDYTKLVSVTEFNKTDYPDGIYSKSLEAATQMRYVQLILKNSTGSAQTSRVREIEVFGTVSKQYLYGINLTQLPGVTASGANKNAEMAIDGDNTQSQSDVANCSAQVGENKSFIIDLGIVGTVNGFRIYLGNKSGALGFTGFDVSYSTDGQNYTSYKVLENLEAAQNIEVELFKAAETIEARYIKFTPSGCLPHPTTGAARTTGYVREFEIYGTVSGANSVYYTLEETAGDTTTYTYTLINNSDTFKNPVIFEVFYEDELRKELKDCKIKTKEIGGYGDTWTIKYSYTAGEEPNRILVWSDLTNIIPLKLKQN